MYNVIIFSKNRAAQLDLLMRSMLKFWPEAFENAVVIFKASSEQFEKGYQIFNSQFPAVLWQETGFKDDVFGAIDPEFLHTVFFTDDDVLLAPVDDYAILPLPDNVVCHSIRLWPGHLYSYTNGCDLEVPQEVKKGLSWRWSGRRAEWGYPMSVDGHIFRTMDIIPVLKKINFNGPNQMEEEMAMHPIDKPMMRCGQIQHLVGVAANLVQSYMPNRVGRHTAEEFNQRYLAGERIELLPSGPYNSTHIEIEYAWKHT